MSNRPKFGEETNYSLVNTIVLRHKIEKKHLRSVGDIRSKGVHFSSTTTNTKISVVSNAQRKSVVSSVSMSLERKDSVQYIKGKSAPCIIPAGQNTVIHVDNYTHVMAQRVTTQSIKTSRSEVTAESNNSIVPCATSIPNLEVVLSGVDSPYSTNKALNMNKQKLQDLKSNASAKRRGHKNSLADYKNSKGGKKPDTATKIKPILKKRNRRKNVIKAIKAKTPKIKLNTEVKQVKNSEEEKQPMQKSAGNPPESKTRILRPCVFTIKNQKCLSEVKCLYLHSDFPCKYYYLNIPCPKGANCQFKHNGNLEPELEEALRSHILELLSPNPSTVETHFVEQMHCIEDISRRLQCFKNNQAHNEVIEVDDDGDDNLIIVEESSNDYETQNVDDDMIKTHPTINDLDVIYASIKETNSTVDEIGIKLKLLKSRKNIMPNEKMNELQRIYSLLKEQEKRLKHYGKLNATATKAEITRIDGKKQIISLSSNIDNDETHDILVDPSIVSEIRSSENMNDDENIMTSAEPANTKVPSIVGTKFVTNEEENVINLCDDENSSNVELHQCLQATNLIVSKRDSVEFIANENLPQPDSSDNKELLSFPKESVTKVLSVSSNEDCGEEPIASTENVYRNKNLKKLDINNKDAQILIAESIESRKLETKKFECNDFQLTTEELLEKNNSVDVDKNVKSTSHNETHEVDINNEIKVIENTIKKDHIDYEELEKKSPCKLKKRESVTEVLSVSLNEDNEEENVSRNTNLKKFDNNNEDAQILIAESIESGKLETKKFECNDFQPPTHEIVEKNKSVDIDKNVKSIFHNETHEVDINNERKVIEDTIKKDHIESEEMEEKSPYKFKKRRLRSNTVQESEETANKIGSNKLTPKTAQLLKPYRTRRLRLPQPSKNTSEKSNISTDDNSKEEMLTQNVQVPLTQNVILSKRFLKKFKTKLEQQSLLDEMQVTDCDNHVATNLEKNLSKLHSENTESLSKNIDKNNSLNLSQYHFPTDSPIIHRDIPTSSDSFSSFNLQLGTEKSETAKNSYLNHRISFETPNSSLAVISSSHITEKLYLGNPQVVLNKLKTFKHQTTQKNIQADSTTSHVNAIVTSSTRLASERSKLKRCILTAEYDVDSFLEKNKCLKFENSKTARKVKIDERKRTLSHHSYDSKNEDSENESSDEKLTMESSYNNKEFEEPFESCTTREQPLHHTSQYEHKEQENESDLRQQIENVSNKSDLQLQTQCQEQQRFQQQKDVNEPSTATATSLVAKNKTLLHINCQEQGRALNDEKRDTKDLLHRQQYEANETENGEITNTSNSCDSIEKYEQGRTQSLGLARIDKPGKLTSNSSNKYSNETSFPDKEEGHEYAANSSLFTTLSNHLIKRQITFEKSAVNITPISSPTYEDDTIASPSPVRKVINFPMGGEIDGRLTYPPIPYILQEIDLGKIEVNKPQFIDKLKKTIQLDPRIFKTHHKNPLTILGKSPKKTSNALLQNITSNTFNFTSTHQPSSSLPQAAASMISFDPRNRTSASMADISTSALSNETALALYHSRQNTAVAAAAAAAAAPSSLSSSFYHTHIPNSVPLALQYSGTSQPIIQPQQQQTLNMFLYGCLQRSSWYQSLMSTIKIQINQSISQLVRALNSFHRERVFNPELIFDIFKIDCAGELLEIMRNLGMYVDANGVINEQRHVPSPSGHTCCNEMPVNAAYSSIQQFLTPNTHCSALTPSSSHYTNAAGTTVGQHHVNEPILSCYVRAPEPVHKHSDECVTTNQPQQDCCNCNKQCNNKRSDNNYNNNNCNNQNNNRRYGNHFKKPYDNSNNNNNNGNNNYQHRSNHRSSYNNNYNNNPRFMKPGSTSPKTYNSSPSNSPKKNYDGGNGGGFGGAGGRGEGGRFNSNKRFNNYNNNDNGGSFGSFSGSKEKSYNTEPKISPTPENSLKKSSKSSSTDEECWDSDN